MMRVFHSDVILINYLYSTILLRVLHFVQRMSIVESVLQMDNKLLKFYKGLHLSSLDWAPLLFEPDERNFHKKCFQEPNLLLVSMKEREG